MEKMKNYILGKHLNEKDGTVCMWELDFPTFAEVGDYAIVENLDDIALVKIVAIFSTKPSYAYAIANGYKVNKKVISIVRRDEVRPPKSTDCSWGKG